MGSPYIHLDQIRGVILDWDGVIAESRLDFTPIREKYFGGRRVPLLEAAAEMQEPLKTELMNAIRDEEMRGAARSAAVAGAFDFISLLDGRRIPWCVLSRNCRESIERAAQSIGFTLPPQTFGREARYVKPDPRALTDAAQSIGVPASQCLVVGDYLYELLGARRAGMRCVLVNNCSDRECAALADAVFPTMRGLAGSFLDGGTLVPWEYHDFARRCGRQKLERMHEQTVNVDTPLSFQTLGKLGELAASGLGRLSAGAARKLGAQELREQVLFSPSWLEMPAARVLRSVFAARYPLLHIDRGEAGRPLSSIGSVEDFAEEISPQE
ncbi:HAD family hydrolase [Pyramidobacter piscolens]|uniref:HAD family hydrolase n=1 Tax=Pyramidobacter piscolens TaxID=638849 RepID=UPI001FCBCB3D|nr:HAD family phosphatase [Pyramidobacter piscolens]BDF78693.1 hypothetical protein CE91St28_14870 [Pyramidobacter piscolens]